jgi:hypothetical protein
LLEALDSTDREKLIELENQIFQHLEKTIPA